MGVHSDEAAGTRASTITEEVHKSRGKILEFKKLFRNRDEELKY